MNSFPGLGGQAWHSVGCSPHRRPKGESMWAQRVLVLRWLICAVFPPPNCVRYVNEIFKLPPQCMMPIFRNSNSKLLFSFVYVTALGGFRMAELWEITFLLSNVFICTKQEYQYDYLNTRQPNPTRPPSQIPCWWTLRLVQAQAHNTAANIYVCENKRGRK